MLVAVPFDAHEPTLKDLVDVLDGKIVVDCVNPLGFDKQGPFVLDLDGGSAAEQAQVILPGSRVIGAFHNVSAVLLADLSVTDLDTDVLVLGEDRDDVAVVQQLADRIPGMRGLFGGRLRNAGSGRGTHGEHHRHQPSLQDARGDQDHRAGPVNEREIGRAVTRAESGKSIDVAEAAALLAARGDDLDRLMAVARRVRDVGPRRRRAPGRRHVQAQGVHPADPAVPRPVPLLHVRHGAGQGRGAPFLSPDEVLEIARARCGDGLQGGAVHPRRPAGGPVAGGEGVAGGGRLRVDAGVRARDGDPGARGDRAAAAPQPRGDELGGDEPAQGRGALDGDDARDDVASPVRGARASRTTAARTRIRRCGCGCWRTPDA